MVFIKNCLWVVEIALFANIILLIVGVEPRSMGVLFISIGLIALIEVYTKSPAKNSGNQIATNSSTKGSKSSCEDFNCNADCGDACEAADIGLDVLDCLDF